MKLHRTKAYSRGGKDYYVWKVNLPAEQVEALGWEHGQPLKAVARKTGLFLQPEEKEK